jgi:hypothetical protein
VDVGEAHGVLDGDVQLVARVGLVMEPGESAR